MKHFFQYPQQRHTLDSDYATQSGTQSNAGFQMNFLSPTPSKSRIKHFDSIPPSEKKHKHQKSSIEINSHLNKIDKNQQSNHNIEALKESIVDIRVSNPTETFFYPSKGKIDGYINSSPQSSKKSVPYNEDKDYRYLNKSGTEPLISSVKQCEGFTIATNLVQEPRNFRKDKVQCRPSDKNKTMNYLTVTNPNTTLNTTQKALLASRVIHQSRITLKDYMFMANTSSKKAAQNKRTEIKQSRKALKTEPSMQPTPKPNVSVSQIREKYHEQKYHISNDNMGQVLKASIREQILSLNDKIRNIEHWMQMHSKVRSQQLILLYNMRNDLQQYNKKFDQSIAKLITDDQQQIVTGIYDQSRGEESSESAEKSEIYQLQDI